MSLGRWLRRRRLERQAGKLLRTIFARPDLLRGTSLRPHHGGRCVLTDFDVEKDQLVSVRFGIVRHPRPYAFSRQSHKVIEYYVYDVKTQTLGVVKGHNVTREGGEDSG